MSQLYDIPITVDWRTPRQIARANNEQYYIGSICKRGHLSGKRLVLDGQCVECRSIMRKIHNDKNRKRARKWELNKSYGISLEDYSRMLQTQNGVCKICKNPESVKNIKGKIKNLAVDHCHTTGKVRGLLCYACNVAIGFLKNNPDLIRQAALYCEETK